MQLFLELYWSFFQVGAFSVGGGLASLPLIQHQIVDLRGWLTLTDFANVVTISEMTPGPIALNAATFVGTQIAGLPGAVIATLGCITPSCILVLTIAHFFFKYNDLRLVQGVLGGLRPAVVAMIGSAGLSMCALALLQVPRLDLTTLPDIRVDYIAVLLFTAALVAIRKFKCPPVAAMVASGAAGLALYALSGQVALF